MLRRQLGACWTKILRHHRHPGADCWSCRAADAVRLASADAVAWRWHAAGAAVTASGAGDPGAQIAGAESPASARNGQSGAQGAAPAEPAESAAEQAQAPVWQAQAAARARHELRPAALEPQDSPGPALASSPASRLPSPAQAQPSPRLPARRQEPVFADAKASAPPLAPARLQRLALVAQLPLQARARLRLRGGGVRWVQVPARPQARPLERQLRDDDAFRPQVQARRSGRVSHAPSARELARPDRRLADSRDCAPEYPSDEAGLSPRQREFRIHRPCPLHAAYSPSFSLSPVRGSYTAR
jgi:hypothetical protein